MIKKLFYPFYKISKTENSILIGIEILIVLAILQSCKFTFFPKPTEIFDCLIVYLTSPTFYLNLASTIVFLMLSFVISIVITLIFSYSYTMNLFKPFIDFISKCRYIPFNCIIILLTGAGHLKYSAILFGLIPYFTSSYTAIITETINNEKEINKSLINRQNYFETLYEVVIIGKLDDIFSIIGQNFAYAIGMLVMAENLEWSEGGIGTMITSNVRHLKTDEITTITLIILIFGYSLDKLISLARKSLFPYKK